MFRFKIQLKYVIVILFVILSSISSTDDFYLRKEFSITKPYSDLTNWNILGYTMITPKYIRLTSDEKGKVGHLWNAIPWDSSNWELHVHFKVHGADFGELHGDGFVIWYVQEPMQLGPVFGSKDYFSGLGIFLDTYSNHNGPHAHEHPYISAIINNGTLHYDHDRDGTLTQLGGCSSSFRNLNTDSFLAIRYQDNSLRISTDMGSGTWESCIHVKDVYLPTNYFFGVSAATGDLSDNHDIISLRLYQIGELDQDKNKQEIKPFAQSAEETRTRVKDPSSWSSLKRRLLWVVGICVTLGVIIFGLLMWWQKKQHYNSKRFY